MSNFGTSRNVTDKFVAYRREQHVGRVQPEDRMTAKLMDNVISSSSHGIGPGDIELGQYASSSSGPQSGWIGKAEQIKDEISRLNSLLNQLRQQHSQALLVSFDTDDTSDQRLGALATQFKNSLRNLDREVKSLSGLAVAGQAAVVAGVQRQLAGQLFKISVAFRKEETAFLNKLEAESGLQKGFFGMEVEDDTQAAALPQHDSNFSQRQLQHLEQQRSLGAEREAEIRQIVDTISELAQIMQDLSVLVTEQGTILDRIDHNVEQVAGKVDQGVRELQKAENTQKGGAFVYCFMFLVIGIGLLLGVIVIRALL